MEKKSASTFSFSNIYRSQRVRSGIDSYSHYREKIFIGVWILMNNYILV
jgi:hypothetical protein